MVQVISVGGERGATIEYPQGEYPQRIHQWIAEHGHRQDRHGSVGHIAGTCSVGVAMMLEAIT